MAKLDLEPDLDELYAAVPADFIRARDELVGRRRADDRQLASQVKHLRKPTQAAWAINQLHLQRDPALNDLVEAGEGLKSAVHLGAGPQEQETVRQARGAAVVAAAAAALNRIESAGIALAAATAARLTRSLEAIAAYGGDLPAPGPGRMEVDLEPPGFELLAGLQLPRPARPAVAKPTGPAKRQRVGRQQATASRPEKVAEPSATPHRGAGQAKTGLRRAEAARRQQTKVAVDRAEVAVDRAEVAADRAEVAADRAETEMEAATAALTKLRSQLEAASRRVASARRGLDGARRVRDRARLVLAKLNSKASGSDDITSSG